MSNVLFVADLHLGHKTASRQAAECGKYRGGPSVEEHDEWVIDTCLAAGPTKRTVWWLLGDVAMEVANLALLDRLPGRKMLVLGNHDRFDSQVYLKHVERLEGIVKKYGFWLSHAPIHPDELRGKPNIHGHCHRGLVDSQGRYLNVAIEWLPEDRPVTLEEAREYFARSSEV